MNKKRLFLVGTILIIAAIIVTIVLTAHSKKQLGDLLTVNDHSKIAISLGKCDMTVEVVNSIESRQTGLSNRSEIGSDGMLFAYDTKFPWSFWMLDMQFPIDMIFFSDEQVVDIIPNIPPPEKGTPEENLDKYYARNFSYVEGNEDNPNLDESTKLKWNMDINFVLETNAGRASECEITNGNVLQIAE
jgi:uncharacterized membrane protein (UPF0127 family)